MDVGQNIVRGPHTSWDKDDRFPPAIPQSRAVFPDSRIKATGRYRAHFVPWWLARQVVTHLLPRGLEIASPDIAPAEKHPVLFVFGAQEHVRPLWQWGQGLRYLEFLLAIPYLQWTDSHLRYRGPFVYLPRLYLDHWLPVLLGWLCGFAKERAHMHRTDKDYRIATLFARKPLIRGSFRPCGQAGRPDDFPQFAALRDIFLQPLVTSTPFGCMCLDFDWQLERAQLQPMEADVHIEQPFLRGLPRQPFRVDGIDRWAGGAFELDVPWTLSRPFRPSSIGVAQPELAALSLPRPHFGDRKVPQAPGARSEAPH